MPGSWSGRGDSATWILADVGFLLLALLLQWLEGRTGAPFNKGVAVYHLVLRDHGGQQLFLAGLGGEGESVSTPASNVVEELLTGRGGVEECICFVVNSTSSWWSYPCYFLYGGNMSKLFLSFGHGGEGEESDGAAALHWMRFLWSCESATSSAAPKHRHHAVAIFGRWDGPAELECFRSSSVFLLLCRRIYSNLGAADRYRASPSGFVPSGAPGGLGWRSNLIYINRSPQIKASPLPCLTMLLVDGKKHGIEVVSYSSSPRDDRPAGRSAKL
jgi:hypothetical protein